MNKHPSHILKAPRITEKAAYLSSQGCYVFNIHTGVTKREVAEAVREVYKVTPRKVTLAATPRKSTSVRGSNRKGFSSGVKKAYVFLKQGDSIDLG